eukprot:2002581-Pyramimonas_sp.AAC.1
MILCCTVLYCAVLYCTVRCLSVGSVVCDLPLVHLLVWAGQFECGAHALRGRTPQAHHGGGHRPHRLLQQVGARGARPVPPEVRQPRLQRVVHC